MGNDGPDGTSLGHVHINPEVSQKEEIPKDEDLALFLEKKIEEEINLLLGSFPTAVRHLVMRALMALVAQERAAFGRGVRFQQGQQILSVPGHSPAEFGFEEGEILDIRRDQAVAIYFENRIMKEIRALAAMDGQEAQKLIGYLHSIIGLERANRVTPAEARLQLRTLDEKVRINWLREGLAALLSAHHSHEVPHPEAEPERDHSQEGPTP